MKINPELKITANLVANDPELTEKLKAQSRKIKGLELIFSEKPLFEKEFDAYVMPVDMLSEVYEFLSTHRPGAVKSSKAVLLCYGDWRSLRRAFLAGCADYLKEPWDAEELECRLMRTMQREKETFSFSWGELELKPLKIFCSGGEIRLSFQEYRICRILFQNFGQVVPREVLYYAIWGRPAGGPSRVVDVHISAIRKKLEALIPAAGKCISAVRGIGYMVS